MSGFSWHTLGRFRVLWRPLPQNEIWTTHWIYLGGRCIGKQLSVPSLEDCLWYERTGGVFAYGPQDTSKYGERINRAYGKSRKASADLATEPAE